MLFQAASVSFRASSKFMLWSSWRKSLHLYSLARRYTSLSRTRLFCSDGTTLSETVQPIPYSQHQDSVDIGAEITGVAKQDWPAEKLRAVLLSFYRLSSIKELAHERQIDSKLFKIAFEQFRLFIVKSNVLPPELHVLLFDLVNDRGAVEDLFPYFYDHAQSTFPHLRCIEDLRRISDLSQPANWYPEARSRTRKIVYHAGPTNSGKTYHALQKFTKAKSGIYCGPLRLLATEVFQKTNAQVFVILSSFCLKLLIY